MLNIYLTDNQSQILLYQQTNQQIKNPEPLIYNQSHNTTCQKILKLKMLHTTCIQWFGQSKVNFL